MGDKNYKWWVGFSEDDERFSGPYDTGEEAVDVGREEYDGRFYVVEADKSVIVANIDGEFYAELIMEDICENNEECFGEDGPDDPWAHIPDAHRTLGRAIEDAVKTWLAANPGKTWCFGDVRSGAYVEHVEAA
jgi:hypothetical protein